MTVQFNLPTLVTLTAPTCAGKNFLLERLVSDLGFGRIVSTTDRAPREGEIEGTHYFFISNERSRELEEAGLLAELVTYNGTRYGVTHEEMERKMQPGLQPPMVILEPNGLEIYRKYCAGRGWQLFTIYVDTPESIRMSRLVDRTTADLHALATSMVQLVLNEAKRGGEVTFSLPSTQIQKIVATNNKRLKAIIEQERTWSNQARWDVIADGTNAEKAIASVIAGVKWRNSRPEIYA